MNQLATLARDVSTYLQELQGRDVPLDLAWQLARDYQLVRCQALYGGDPPNVTAGGDGAEYPGTLTQSTDPGAMVEIAPTLITIDGKPFLGIR